MQLFLGIGAQKSGTTWTYHQLSRHPQVIFPGGKEFHFWDLASESQPAHWLDLLNSHNGLKSDSIFTHSGEITPSYALLKSSVVAKIKAAAPDIKLFFILRNPIERAWSSALMALDRSQMTIDEASDRWLLDHIYSRASRQRGNYLETIKTWHSHFAVNQLAILLYDELSKTPRIFLRRLSDHLELDSTFYTSIPDPELKRPIVPTLSPQQRASPIPGKLNKLNQRPRVLQQLHILYDDKIRALQDYLDLPLSDWITGIPADRDEECKPQEVVVGGTGFSLVSQLLTSQQDS